MKFKKFIYFFKKNLRISNDRSYLKCVFFIFTTIHSKQQHNSTQTKTDSHQHNSNTEQTIQVINIDYIINYINSMDNESNCHSPSNHSHRGVSAATGQHGGHE